MKGRLWFVAGLVVLAGIVAAACAPAAAPPAPAAGEKPAAPEAKEKPQYGGVYRTTTSNPRIGQDPVRTTGSSHYGNFGQAYSNLLRFKFGLDISEGSLIIAPDLAERWENPTPTTWVFYLRKGVKWHNVPPVNGREFTADDVVYGINRLAHEKGSAQAGYWLELEKVEALDRYTVKFTLKNPSASFLTIAAFGFNKMTAKEAVEAGGGNLDKGPLIGTGPWFVTCTLDIECVLKRNPDYFLKDEDGNQLPFLDQRQHLVIADTQARLASFRAKQLDSYGVTPDEKGILEKAHPELLYRRTRSFAHQMVHFRQDRAPWSDERVRTALSMATDRQEVIDTVRGGEGWFNLGWVNPADDWDLPQEEFKRAYKRDTAGAKKLLAEAGFPNGLDATLWCANYGQIDIVTCELLLAQWAQAGFRIKISNIHDPPVYLTRVFKRDGEFEDLAWGPQGTFLEPELWLSAYLHSKGSRNSGYTKDPKLDEMIEAQRRELDPAKRKKIIQEIERYHLQKNWVLSIYTPIGTTARWPWFKGFYASGAGDYPAGRQVDYYWIDQELAEKQGRPK